MNASIGIDIGKKKCDYCVVDGKGTVLERGQYLNTMRDAKRFAEGMAEKYGKGGSCRAACETTANMWRTTYDMVEAAGISIQLANTYMLSIISKTAKKTDRVDAEKIAQVLRMNMIPACYVPPLGVRGIRTVVRQRIKLVQERTREINRIRSMLDAHDVKLRAVSVYLPKALKQLESTALATAHDNDMLQLSVRHVRYLTEEIAGIEKRLEADAAQNEDARLLTSMTGVGPFLAILLVAEIGTITRFATAKKMASWGGLCPVVYQSGDSTYAGKIKKRGSNSLISWAMCEAANTAVLHDPRMKAVYESAKRRHAGKHAPAIIVGMNLALCLICSFKTRKVCIRYKLPAAGFLRQLCF